MIALLLTVLMQWPGEVAAFVKQRELCDHLRGEENMVNETNEACKGTDRALANLKHRYRDNDEVLRVLSSFEPRIEARDYCAASLPDSLAKLLRSRYPGFGECAGATRINFYGRSTPQYAIGLMRDDELLVLVAEKNGLRELDRIHAISAPRVSAAKRQLTVDWHESATIVYRWNGSKVVKINASD